MARPQTPPPPAARARPLALEWRALNAVRPSAPREITMSMLRLVASCLLVASSALAAPVTPVLFQDLHWRRVGPFRGGRVLAVSGVPGEPRHFYFGAVNGGVWESTNAGRTWRPIFGTAPVGSIGALAIAPSNPRVIYAGTGEADMRSDISQGKGVYRSDDGGATWRFDGLGDSQQIGRIQVDPHDANVAWVAALGHPSGPNAERGVFRTRGGGAHWTKVLGPDANTGAIDVVLAPDDPRVLYAALWQARRTPWNIYPPSSGPGSGVLQADRRGGPSAGRGGHRRAGGRGGRRGPSTPPRAAPARGSTSRPTAASTGRSSPATALPRRPVASASRWRRASPRACTRWSTPTRAGATAPTIAAHTGGGPAPTRGSGSAAGISAASPWSRRTPTWSTCATRSSSARRTAVRPSRPSKATPRATTSTRCGSIRRTRRAACWARTRARS